MKISKTDWCHKDYRDEGIGFSLDLDALQECINAHSNEPYYRSNARRKLNHPANKKDKNAAFKVFGLDGSLDYEGNLKLHEAEQEEQSK